MRFIGHDSDNTHVSSGKVRKIREELIKEQKKLEELIGELFRSGGHNMGEDLRILRQSSILDKLIVDEMLLHDINEKYSGNDSEIKKKTVEQFSPNG